MSPLSICRWKKCQDFSFSIQLWSSLKWKWLFIDLFRLKMFHLASKLLNMFYVLTSCRTVFANWWHGNGANFCVYFGKASVLKKSNVNSFMWCLPVCQSAQHPVVPLLIGSHIYLTLKACEFSTSAVNRRNIGGYQVYVRCPLVRVLPNSP